jgi:hypothetical protein
MNWQDITLSKYQQLEKINNQPISEIDKVLFSACVIFDKTEYELDNMVPKKVLKYTKQISKIFSAPFPEKHFEKIGRYFITYDISKITFGQYIELAFFLSNKPLQNAHYILATMSNAWLRKNKAKDHRRKASYFLIQPVTKITGSLKVIIENFTGFNNEYKDLFGLDKEVSGDTQEDRFNKRYGWIYSASKVAEYERITLDEAFGLPIRQALNDLMYLKAKDKYEYEQFKKHNKTTV